MKVESIIAIISALSAILSSIITWFVYRANLKINTLSETPILLPNFEKKENGYYYYVKNEHPRSVAKDVSLCLSGAKLSTKYKVENEFLAPDARSRKVAIDENIDGSSFYISYLNIFDKKVEVSGTVHFIDSLPDLQNISFSIQSISK
jgi:hypothetical protein